MVEYNSESFTQIPRQLLSEINKTFGPEVLGVYVELISNKLDGSFRFIPSVIAKRCSISTRKVGQIMKKLAEIGLAQLKKLKGEAGRFIGSEWIVFKRPQEHNKESPPKELQDGEKPMRESQHDFFDGDAHSPTVGKTTSEKITNTNNYNDIKVNNTNMRKECIETEFERFYSQYPRKRDRSRALSEFERLLRGKTIDQIQTFTETLIHDVQTRICHDSNWREQRFIPYAKRYLAQELWNDQIESHPAPYSPVVHLPQSTRHMTLEQEMDRGWAP